jgi:DNA primase
MRYVRFILENVDDRRQLAALTDAAARFFAGEMGCGWAPGYLASRGFGATLWREWDIGYAPATWTALTDHLRGLGFSQPAVEAAGLAKRSAHGSLIDVFRDRIMFPVRDLGGTVCGFIGRAPPAAGDAIPVYLNTRTTSLYRKSSLLFGCYEGQAALAAGACPVITEGPLDAIAITVAGRTGSPTQRGSPAHVCYVGVAPCGTALTPAQVRLLNAATTITSTAARGHHPAAAVVVAFDADKAGRRAAIRAHSLLRDVPGDLLTVPFPAGSDPAGYFREHSAAALAELLDEQRHPLADMVVDASMAKFDRWLEFTDAKFLALQSVAPLIAALPANQVARQVARVAARLGLTHAEVTSAITGALPEVIAGAGS